MANLKQQILNQIVRPALREILPTVLARVVRAGWDTVDIEVPDIFHQTQPPTYRYSPDDANRLEEGPARPMMRLYTDVPVCLSKGFKAFKLEEDDAVWVQFLGNSLSEPRIVGYAGRWHDLDPKTGRPRADLKSYEHEASGAMIPNEAIRR